MPIYLERLVTSLPLGFQEMIYEQDFFEPDLIRYWAHLYSRTARIRSNSDSGLNSNNFDFDVPVSPFFSFQPCSMLLTLRVRTRRRFGLVHLTISMRLDHELIGR